MYSHFYFAHLSDYSFISYVFLNDDTLSSQSNGKCNRISSGSASAAMTMNSDIPLLSVFVAEIKNLHLYHTLEKSIVFPKLLLPLIFCYFLR